VNELTRVLVVAWLVTGDSNLSTDVHRTIIETQTSDVARP
jgi:hypothetical protein